MSDKENMNNSAMGIQNSENENDSPQEDVDGEKLKELERSLDGLFDDIMTPPAARPLLGGDMTLPKRAWKHSKPVRDDVWRQDIPGNVSSPLLSSKTSSSKELKKDSTIPSPLPMRNMSNLSPTHKQGVSVPSPTTVRQEVDEWCLRSEEEEDEDEDEYGLVRMAHRSADRTTTTTAAVATAGVVSESPTPSRTMSQQPPVSSSSPLHSGAKRVPHNPRPLSPRPSQVTKICSILFWLCCVIALFCIGVCTIAVLDPEMDSAPLHSASVWTSLRQWYGTCPVEECGAGRMLLQDSDSVLDLDMDLDMNSELTTSSTTTINKPKESEVHEAPPAPSDVVVDVMEQQASVLLATGTEREGAPPSASPSESEESDHTNIINPSERISIRIKLKPRVSTTAEDDEASISATASSDSSDASSTEGLEAETERETSVQIVQKQPVMSFISRFLATWKRKTIESKLMLKLKLPFQHIKMKLSNIFIKLK